MKPSGAWFDEESDAYLLGLLRVLLGVLICSQTIRIFRETLSGGYFGAVFHLPVLPESWVPSEHVYFALLGVEFVGGVLAISGFAGRAGLFAASLTGIYLLACDRLHYHNNRFSLFLIALLCAFAPSDRSFLLFRGRRHTLKPSERIAPTFARRLIKLQVAAIYLTSSTGKLLDPDWRSGIAMLPRFQKGFAYLAKPDSTVPPWIAEAARSTGFAELMAKAAISTEFFLALGLLLPRTRVAALWLGFGFHVGIELNARVQLFSYLMGASYIAFVTPELRERELHIDKSSSWGRALARLLPWLDWLARFRLSNVAPRSGSFAVVTREGRLEEGVRAWAALARAIPLLFPIWPFLLLAATLRKARHRPPT